MNPHNINLVSFNNTQSNREGGMEFFLLFLSVRSVYFSCAVREQRQGKSHQLWKDDVDPEKHTWTSRSVNSQTQTDAACTQVSEVATAQPVTIFVPLWKCLSAPGLLKDGKKDVATRRIRSPPQSFGQTCCPLGSFMASTFKQDADSSANCHHKLIYSVINSEMSSFPLANIFQFLV